MTKHNTHDWLSLVSMSGLVVSEPVLAEALPGGPERVPLEGIAPHQNRPPATRKRRTTAAGCEDLLPG